MPAKMRLAAGDTVVVLSGRDKGKRGRVKLVRHSDRTLEVEGVNVVKRHTKATPKAKAGILDKELPLAVSRVMYVCPKCNKPAKIAFVMKGNAKERACRRCGETAERPVKA
ncbi:MAG TPA: 50S ribosomal protein L24 [Candidatus Eremiobacteraceae bacterium]|nr:50S ribosomal protein L24 [Candidatus Eremiobacteraceae bacterium]